MMPLQLAETCRRLGQRLGCALWDEELNMPFMRSINPVRFPPLQHVGATISARGPVRVFLVVLTNALSGNAARAAVTTSPAMLVGEAAFEVGLDVNQFATMVANSQADVLVIVGGYDKATEAAQTAVLSLCRMAAQAVARLPRPSRPVVAFAGSKSVADRVAPLFNSVDAMLLVEVVDNVLPEPEVVRRGPLSRLLTYQYWRLTQRIMGFKDLARWVTSPAQANTVESSFVQMVQAWAYHKSLPWVHGLYAGPAWWLHVWAGMSRQGAQVLFAEPESQPDLLNAWPPLTLVSGEWPEELWPRPARAWSDRRGLAPVVASLGQVAPRAMMDVLENDLLLMGVP